MRKNLDISEINLVTYFAYNIFCQSLGPSLYRGSTVLNFEKVGGPWPPRAPPPARALIYEHENERMPPLLNLRP